MLLILPVEKSTGRVNDNLVISFFKQGYDKPAELIFKPNETTFSSPENILKNFPVMPSFENMLYKDDENYIIGYMTRASEIKNLVNTSIVESHVYDFYVMVKLTNINSYNLFKSLLLSSNGININPETELDVGDYFNNPEKFHPHTTRFENLLKEFEFYKQVLLREYEKIDYIDEIKVFNEVNGLLESNSFNIKVEVINILEELLELTNIAEPRELASEIYEKYFKNNLKEDIEEKEIVDAFADINVFSIGAMLKLKYEPNCVLKEVSKHINSRKGMLIDGKFVKDKKHKMYETDFTKCKTR